MTRGVGTEIDKEGSYLSDYSPLCKSEFRPDVLTAADRHSGRPSDVEYRRGADSVQTVDDCKCLIGEIAPPAVLTVRRA